MKIINGIPREAKPDEDVALDIEMFKQEDRLHRPTGMFACLSVAFNGGEVYQITDPTDIGKTLGKLRKARQWVFQNALYDLRQLRRWAKVPRVRVWDTMVVEQDLFGGYYNAFGLDDLYRRWTRGVLPKEVRGEFSGRESMTEKMRQYAAKDAVATLEVRNSQAGYCITEDEDITPYYWDIDEPALWAALDIKPVRIDVDAWLAEAKRNEIKYQYIVDELGFNPISPKQVKEAFKGADLKDTKATTLENLINSLHVDQKWGHLAERVLDARRARKLASTYGAKWIDDFVEDGNLVYADWRITGAETGRMSCRSPNLMQIPARRNPIFRTFFIPKNPKGYMLIGDVSQQEPRFTAHFSQDRRLIELIKSGANLHQGVADALDTDYDRGKAINLGIVYGLTKYGLAKQLGISEAEAGKYIMKYKMSFPGVSDWMTNQQRSAMSLGYVRTASGRRIWMNRHAWGWERNAINAPIQGSAADHAKSAMVLFLHYAPEFPLVLMVHDEMVADLEPGESKKYRKIMKDAWVEAGRRLAPDIPMKIGIAGGKNWGAKK